MITSPFATDYKDDIFHTFAVDDILWQGYKPGIIKFITKFVVPLVEEKIEEFIQTEFNVTIDLDLTKFFPTQLQNGTLAFFR